jgi:hypothetical protein
MSGFVRSIPREAKVNSARFWNADCLSRLIVHLVTIRANDVRQRTSWSHLIIAFRSCHGYNTIRYMIHYITSPSHIDDCAAN